jgi:hypothetical protein
VASAINGKIYPPEMCSFEGNGSFTGWSNAGQYFTNTSTSTMLTICPAIRDIVNGTGIDSAYLVVHGVETSNVRIVAVGVDGTAKGYPGTKLSPGHYGWGTEVPGGNGFPTPLQSNYRFELDLPANSYIAYYRLDEF